MLDEVAAVAFDAVGTLLRPEPPAPAVYAEVGRRFGSRLSAAEVGKRFRAAFARQEELDRDAGLRTSEEREARRWQEIVAEVLPDVTDPRACFAELYDHFGRPGAWAIDPDAERVLDGLGRRGYRLALASNFDRRLRPVADVPALRAVSHLVISSEVGWRKPAAAFFSALCDRLGLAAGKVLLVGDDLDNDFRGARACGLRAALFDPAGKSPGVAPWITRLAELLDHLPA